MSPESQVSDPSKVSMQEKAVKASLKVEEFKEGDPIYFGYGYNREAEYTWRELHAAPNKEDYAAHLRSIPNSLRTDQEKANLRLLSRHLWA